MPIHAPYNFVPLSKKVFFPDWSAKVSHDVPFSDGICGTIQCTLTNVSPIYIRNGGNWTHDQILDDRNEKTAQSFFRVGTDFIIPGTSIKGMLRNVIEIASFGKMSRVDDHRYSVRDLQNRKIYGDFMTHTVAHNVFQPLVHAAWLIEDKDRNWELVPCDFARAEREDLIRFHPENPDLRSRQSAVQKYQKWGSHTRIVNFDCTPEQPHPHSGGKKLVYKRATNLGKGEQQGVVVLTGQPAPDTVPHNAGKKHLEFIFFDRADDRKVRLSDKVRKEFIFIHSESDGRANTEWSYWQPQLASGEPVPVFYLGTQANPTSIGLAMMYRLPYRYSIKEAIDNTRPDHNHADLDLAETMFGFANETEGLKDRIFVSPALAKHGTARPRNNHFHTILGSPKPTYYPNYIEQPNPAGGYKTLMDSDAKLRGWKRYPGRRFDENDVVRPAADQQNVATKFIPLQSGAEFSFSIRVHNLRPAEIGALLWAVEWGGNTELCHSLGMGKSFGCGQVKIKVLEDATNLKTITGQEIQRETLIAEFENLMRAEVAADWRETEQIVQLLGMANPANETGKVLRHMTIASNQFVNGKMDKERLLPHFPYAGISDEQRFKDLKPRPKDVSSVAGKKAPKINHLAVAMKRLETIDGWGDFKQHVLENKTLLANREKAQVVKQVLELAQNLRTRWKAKWDADRDRLIAEWLEPIGQAWPPVEPSVVQQSDEAAEELARVMALSKWSDYLAAPANLDTLSKNGLKKLKEKLERWGCKDKDAKDDKKTVWQELNHRMKS